MIIFFAFQNPGFLDVIVRVLLCSKELLSDFFSAETSHS